MIPNIMSTTVLLLFGIHVKDRDLPSFYWTNKNNDIVHPSIQTAFHIRLCQVYHNPSQAAQFDPGFKVIMTREILETVSNICRF